MRIRSVVALALAGVALVLAAPLKATEPTSPQELTI